MSLQNHASASHRDIWKRAWSNTQYAENAVPISSVPRHCLLPQERHNSLPRHVQRSSSPKTELRRVMQGWPDLIRCMLVHLTKPKACLKEHVPGSRGSISHFRNSEHGERMRGPISKSSYHSDVALDSVYFKQPVEDLI